MDIYKNCPIKKRPLFCKESVTTLDIFNALPMDLSIKLEKCSHLESQVRIKSEIFRDMDYESIRLREIDANGLIATGLNSNGQTPESPIFNGLVTPLTSPSISLNNIKVEESYKNCPIKKRPVFNDEPAISSTQFDDQPQDLSIKRRATDDLTCAATKDVFFNLISKRTKMETKSEPSPKMDENNHSYTSFNLLAAGWNPSGQPSASSLFGGLMTPPTSPSSYSLETNPLSEDLPFSIPNATTSVNTNICRFECDKCLKVYSTIVGLSKHRQYHCLAVESHKGNKQHSCEDCGKSYTTVGALKMHINTHSLPCKCPICGKGFSRPWLLQGHIRTHTGEKPFSCSECNRSFADRSNLRAHEQTHVDVKKYACDGCKKSFSRASQLKKHFNTSCAVAVQSC